MPAAALPATDLSALAANARAWPFEEARKLVERVEKRGGGTVLFETGYGPSGLPHIGTFGEVARTTMVRHAFRVMTADRWPTRLLCFSDDMDGLRKVPDNVPNREMLARHLGKPLTEVPDPFGEHASFGAHNNARLRGFLDAFGFDYEFASATEYYKSGRFDATLLKVLEAYDEVMAIMLPSLREERQASYSPFLPISPATGIVLQVPILERDPDAGTIVYRDPDSGALVEVPVTGGRCKLQWKPDWAMRWAALGVDYEMSGKDLIDSVKLSARICAALGAPPPEGFNYELFLDEKGEKISKSKGNGLTIEDWLAYASPESLSLFMFQKPKSGKRLYFDVIPRHVDDYYTFLGKYPAESEAAQLENPVWHIHSGEPPRVEMPVSFSMLLNLVSASNAHDRTVLWGFLSRHVPGATPERLPALDRMVGYAIRYFDDFVRPTKRFRVADATEREALQALDEALAALPPQADAEAVQAEVYEVGRRFFPDAAKPAPDGRPGVSLAWFSTLYALLLGQERGPRFGSFVALYGIPETRTLIAEALARTD
jgi:lysyl-tRNA synthetase class 1